MITRLTAIALLSYAAGCGGATVEAPITETDLGTEIAELNAEPPAPAPATPATISRADLDRFLAGGPAPVLALVVTEPYKEHGRFVGFQIKAFTQGEPTAIDLRPGDVILAINGRRIERPEHYFEVFEALKTAHQLRFDLRRDGEKQRLVYPIVP
jgi:type II secretory pathway component PulC